MTAWGGTVNSYLFACPVENSAQEFFSFALGKQQSLKRLFWLNSTPANFTQPSPNWGIVNRNY
jgi:hypothetical protein